MLKIFGLSFVSRPFARRCLAIFASQCLCANAFAASVLPTGGQYVAGQGIITTAPKGVVVNQSSTHGIVNWQGFSIGTGNTVQFNNGSGATLNRVTGGNLSQIDGLLKATGSVYLINPQGIVVGSGGKIVTKGSFIGSTRDVNSNDFMNGNALHATGTSSGNVVNQGSITSQYGDTVLVGNSVSNSGTISAPNGTAGLAAGNDVLLRPVGGDARIAVSGGQGNVTNTGTIAAAQAELAAAGGNVYALAGNSGGLVSATGTKTVDGHVWLTSGGTTQVSGTVKAVNSNGSGGTIVATGKNVQIDSTARISANGTTGGTVLIGGDMRGGHDPSAKRVSAAVANAQTTTVANGAQISADGTQDAGGAVVIWSDDQTFFDGNISATGTNGNGGDAEVSSHNILDFTGLVDLTSKYADTGTLLLDPNNLTISTGTTSNAGSSPNYVAGATTSVLKASDLVAVLNSANISVTASGTLTVSSAISWTGATTLTLTSGGELAVNAAITGSNANSGLTLNSTAADVYLQSGVINVHTFTATAATEIVNASGTFTNASGIATLNAGLAAGIGDPNYGVLSLSGTITAGTLTLNAQGWVYPGFTIKASSLLATGGGTFNLFSSSTISQTTSANVIGTLAANVTGELNVSNNGNLIIGSVNGVNGVTAGTFHLTFPSAKTLTQTQPIVATTMALLGTGAGTYTLTNPNNSIANFGAKVATGALSLVDNTSFNIAGLLVDDNGNTLTNGIAATTLTLNSTGNVTQTGAINVTNLELLGTGGNYSLGSTSNVIGTLAANTGSINVARSTAATLTVGTAGGTTGITTTGATTLTGSSTGTGVTISKAINASGALTIGSASNIAVNANVSGSTVTLKPDTGGTGTGSVTFGAAIKATGSTVSIYANSAIDYTANVIGTLYSYLYISTLTALQNIQNNLSGSYALNKDIDASSTATMNGGAGFAPIGTGGNPFTGNFDGMGHVISGLVINRPGANFVGLFGATHNATISNVGLANGSITGGVSVGSLIGYQSGGSVTGSTSSASVTGNLDVGGLVGFGDGLISTSYMTGAVTGTDTVGGLVGDLFGTITQSYATGAVTAGSNAGGLVGDSEDGLGIVTSSYWDTQTTGRDSHSGAGDIADAFTGGMTSAQFATASNFAGWTFGTAAGSPGWVIVDADSTLNNAGGAAGATRPMMLTEASTNGKINNAHQLQLMALNLAGSYTLGANIDMSETARSSGVWLSAGFVPVGYAATDGTGTIPTSGTFAVTAANPFSGSFNGATFTISNLTINRPTTDYVGLFGYVYNPTSGVIIKNVNLIGGSITGRDHVGSILGGNRGYLDDGVTAVITYLNDTTTASSSSSASVNGRDFVGGLYGSAESTYSYFNTGTGTVSGRDYVGGVVGWLSTSVGFNTDMRSTAAVTGRNSVGGLAGYYFASLYGLDYATGNVTATGDDVGGLMGQGLGTQGSSTTDIMYATGAVSGNNNVGGLIGLSGLELSHSFATGAVNGAMNVGGLVGNNDINSGIAFVDQSFATGTVHGVTNVGGLVGLNTDGIGAINNTGGTYATGAVYGTTNVGGLVGSNIGDSTNTFGRITSSYAIGYVSGTTNVGGLVGNSTVSGSQAFIKSSYFDSETSGLSAALGTGTTGTGGIATTSMPKATALLEAALQTNFATAAWGIVANTTLPYFKWLYASAPQVVTGTAYSDRGTTALTGAGANLYVSGLTGSAANVVASAVGSTGKNGFYYFLVPNGTFAVAGKQVLVTTAGANGGATFQEKATASLTGLSIYGTYLKEQATSTTTTLSALSADLALAVGGSATATASLATLANLEIDTTAASFALDQAINTSTLVLSSTGSMTQSGTITASGVLLSGTGGNYALTNANNAIGTIAANTGTVNVSDLSDLTVGAVAGTTGVTTTGATTLASAGNLTIASTAKVTVGANNNAVLSAGANFINNRGSDAVNVSGTGRWVIYSSAPGTDLFGSLNSNNTAIWNGTIGTLAPGSVASGNRYVFAYQPTLTFTTSNATKTYGQVGNVSSNYTISGLQPGVAGAFLADTATSVYSGLPSLSSSGTGMYANVADGPFAINAGLGTLTALNGYSFAFVNTGVLTVNAATLTYTVADANSPYGTLGSLGTISFLGLVAGDGSNIVGTEGLFSGATAVPYVFNTNAGSYSEQVTGISGTGSSNYVLASSGNTSGTFTINPLAITVTGNAASKVYGDGAPAYSYSITGGALVSGDLLGSVDISSLGDAVTAGKGQYDITTANAMFSSGLASNYDITYGTLTNGLTVTARAITLAGNAASKVYGDDAPAYGYTIISGNLANSDTLGSVDVSSAGDAVTANKGLYDVTVANAVFSAGQASNYDITYATLIDGLTVTARAITLMGNAASKVYGDGAPAYGYSITSGNLANTDTLGSVDVSSIGDAATANKGQYDIATANAVFSSGDISNYDITYGTLTNGLTVTARAITVTGDAASKIYGDGAPLYSYSITSGSLANTDTLGSIDVSSIGDAATANKGLYDITTANAVFSSGLASNYDITYGTLSDGLTVSAREITLIGNAASKVYGDGAPAYAYSIISGNLANTDTLGSVDVSSTGDAATANKGGYDITTSNAVFSAGDISNYDITYGTLIDGLTVTARAITVTGNAASKVYGDGAPAYGYTISSGNLVNGDTLDSVDVSSAGDAATASKGQYDIATASAVFSLGDISNYDITYGTLTDGLTVTARAITLTGNASTKVYGDGAPSYSYGVTNGDLVNGDTIGSVDVSSAGDVVTANKGQYDVATANAVFSSGDISNYDITYGTLTDGLTVTARAVTLTGNAASKVYGDGAPSYSYGVTSGNLVNGDTIGSLDVSSTGDVATASKGQYDIVTANAAFSAGDISNYDITYGTLTNGLTVDARAITLTSNAASKVYGDGAPAYSYSVTGGNLVNGDTIGSVDTSSAGDAVTANKGQYDVATANAVFSSGDISNYDITYGTLTDGLTVTARAITLTGNAATKVYGDGAPSYSYGVTSGNLVNGDTIGSVDLSSTGDAATANKGQYDVATANTVFSSGDISNYDITYGTLTDGLTVTARAITLTGNAATKVYGDGAPTYGFSVTGGNLVNGDTIGSLDVSSTGDTVTANKGQYDVSTANAAFSSGDVSNYDITYGTLTNGLTVTARAITLTGDLLTRVYGDANPTSSTGSVTSGNLVNGDTISGVDVLGSTASATSDVGNGYSYSIGNAAFSSGDVSNYDITYADGGLTINVRPITITADAKTKIYGNASPTLTFATSDLGAGTAVLGSLDTSANNTSGVGNYAITQGTVNNANNSNYQITYVAANLTISARPITIVADAQIRTYGDVNPALTYVIGGDGLVNGDALTGGLATGAGVTSNVGGYGITQGSLAASGNYAVSYTPGTLTVTPRALTVSADDLSRTYGDANPALTYGITGGNLVNGDMLTGGLATVAGLTSNVGSYSVTQGSLAASSNYTLTYVGGMLGITQRAITVTANDLSRVYGSANPLLTYTVGGSGLVNGDTLTGGLATSASLHSNVGSYAISQGNLASSPNYVLTFNAGTLALTPASLLISANNSSALTLASAQPTAGYIGLVASDTSSVVTGLQLGLFPVTNNPFAYDIVPFGASAQNYAISYTAGLLTLTAQPSNTFTSPVTPGGQLGTLPSLVLVTGSGTFTFSNVATAAIGADPSILLFAAGLPGDIGAFNQFVITDYSNAIDDSDRLVAAE